LSDRHGSRWVISLGMGLLAFSYVLLWVEEPIKLPVTIHIIALAVGVLVLDIGAQMTQVANQTRIFGLVPSARSRINTVYMTVYFSGAAVGSALATIAWEHWKWNGVCCLAIGFIGLAGLRHATGNRNVEANLHRTEEEDLLLEA
jgi:MFS family permease